MLQIVLVMAIAFQRHGLAMATVMVQISNGAQTFCATIMMAEIVQLGKQVVRTLQLATTMI